MAFVHKNMITKKDLYKEIPHLTHSQEVRIRFNETDAMGIVWHGNYISYFEDGRESFGRAHGISYPEILAAGFTTPIVKSSCEHKLSLRYGDVIRVDTTFVNTPAAKIIFKYKIFNSQNELVCTGETTQVFLDNDGNLQLNNPPFYANWKSKMELE